jgi:hypothetical protein
LSLSCLDPKLISEAKTAFSQSHKIQTGGNIYISEYIVINSKEVMPSAKTKFFNDKDLKDKKIKFFAKDGVLSLISESNINLS